jgi:hypothetical protein
MDRSRVPVIVGFVLLLLFHSSCGAPTSATPTATSAPLTPTATMACTLPTATATPLPPTATPVRTTGRIEGRVWRSDTAKPVPDAVVFLSDATTEQDVAESTADAQGRYLFAEIEPGTYSLSATWKFDNQADAPCQGVDMTVEGWFVIVGVQPEGGLLLVATSGEQFNIAAGDVRQQEIDLSCRGGQGATRAPSTPTPRPTPVPTAPAQEGGPPVIESVNLREDSSSGGLGIFQDITFRDPDGDAYKVHYELVRATIADLQVADGTIDSSSQQQKQGTTITGRWSCGGLTYEVTMRVTVLDRGGNVSNAVEYTMNCH